MKATVIVLSLLAIATAVTAGKIKRGNPKVVHPVFDRRSAGQEKIVGGAVVEPNSVPYQVALELLFGLFFCGGSLISDRWVVTAAHCGELDNHAVVILGAHDLFSDEPQIVILTGNRTIVHEEWDSSTLLNDIALIELPHPVNLSSIISPVALPTRSLQNESFAGRNATASGWGLAHDGDLVQSRYLRAVTSDILTNEECQAAYGEDIPLAPTHICLDGSEGKSACSGDSGGPLVVEQDGELIEIGLTSFGVTAGCEVGYPSAFTRITAYLDWIEEKTGLKLE